MKRLYIILLLAVSSFFFPCCIRETGSFEGKEESHPKGSLTISASHDTETKTTVGDGGTTIYWDIEERIKVFNDDVSGVFTSENKDISATADFTGELVYSPGNLLTAVYPSTDAASFDGDTLFTSLPPYCKGRAGSFAKNANIAAAQSTSLRMTFHNVCGGIRFTLSRDDITKVAFEAVGKEGLAGDMAIVFEDGIPVVKRVWNEFRRVFITPEEGETFLPGRWYYVELIPTTLSQGVNVTLYTSDDRTGIFESADPVTIKRSTFLSKGNLDACVAEWTEPESGEMAVQQQYMDIEIPDEYEQSYLNTLKISNFYGDYALYSDGPGTKVVKKRASKASGDGYAPTYISAPYGVFGNGYMFQYLTDNENNTVMCCMSKGDAPVTMTSKSTAISLLLSHPMLLTSNPDEIEYIVRELESLDEFNTFVSQVDSKIRVAMRTCQSPDYSTLDMTPVIHALVAQYLQTADAVDGIDLIDEHKDVDRGIISLKVRNHYRRVVHVYGKRAWMDETNLVPVRTETTNTTIYDVLRKIQNLSGEVSDIDEDDVKLAEEVIRNHIDDPILNTAFPHMIVPESANYWKIVLRISSTGRWWSDKESSPFESTSEELEFDLGGADKLILDSYGIGRVKDLSDYSDEEKMRMFFVLIHGAVIDFVMPTVKLATGIKDSKPSYDLRYKMTFQAMLLKLYSNLKDGQKLEIFSKLRNGDVDGAMLYVADYVFREVFGSDPFYVDALYNYFKKVAGVSATSKAFRKGLKAFCSKVSLSVAVINISESFLDLSQAIAAALNSDFKTSFIRDLDTSTYLMNLSPQEGSAIQGKQIAFSWDIHMGNRVGGVKYDLQLQFVKGESVEFAKTYHDIIGKSYQVSLDEIPFGTARYRVIAHDPDNSAFVYAQSDWISIRMADYVQPLEAVDLGLPSGLKWASCNVGANAPEEYGDYFAWGETYPKNSFDWDSYIWDNNGLTKYNLEDGKTTLELNDDAARANWGGSWRMPTKDECDELIDNCTTEWTTRNGVNGRLFTSVINGKSIFLPASGGWAGATLYNASSYGNYLSSSLSTDDLSHAWNLDFGSGYVYTSDSHHYLRCYGKSVRPVTDEDVRVSVNGVTLDKTSLELAVDETKTITAIVAPANATQKTVIWTSSNTSVATVSWEGVVTAVASGTATITATTYDGGYKATCAVTVTGDSPSGGDNGHEWVDLGLPSGLKWASCNVGASAPEEYGDYFAWGGTEPQESYRWRTCPFRTSGDSSDTVKFSKYNTSSDYGPIDNKTVLDPEDDAATANWGGSWRMPTHAEWKELRTECTWTWTTQNGVNGRLVTGPNGNSIFLPAAGIQYSTDLLDDAGSLGGYWSSSLNTDNPSSAYGVSFHSGSYGWGNGYRSNGRSVRAVTE